MVSIVVPISNDEGDILSLYDRLTAVAERLGTPYQLLFIDDASRDRSFEVLANIVATDSHLKVIRLRRHFGRTAALSAGFDHATGEIIVAVAGGFRDAVEEIPGLLQKIAEGYDIASAWQKYPNEGTKVRRIFTGLTNWLVARASHVRLHGSEGTLQVYRAEVLKNVRVYGELRRFIPALASFYGARTVEVPISVTSLAGVRSKEPSDWRLGAMFDILTMWFLLRYMTRPMQFFGKLGFIIAGLGALALLVLAVPKLWMTGDILQEHGPFVLLCSFALLAGALLFCSGLLGEILSRIYFESQGRRIYAVREIRTRGQAG
jgi:glycosyltransferase involved in cell wall biosynthesis